MKIRWKILIGIALLLGVIVSVAVVHHFQLKQAVQHYQAELKDRGEPMKLAEVIPPRLPPEKNSASQFLAAASLFTTNENILTTNWPIAMRGIASGKAQILWQQKNIHDFNLTNSWEDLAEALAMNEEAFNRLAAITNRSMFDFGLRYEQRFEMLITNLVVEKKTAQKLTAKTINNLHRGQTGPAAENIRVMLSLVEGTSDERTAISQLVRIAIFQIAFAATWEFLQSSNLTDGQLAGLQADWTRPEFIQAMARVLPVEREGGETAAASWRSSTKEMLRVLELLRKAAETFGNAVEEETTFNNLKIRSQIFLWRYWWSYPDELRGLHGYQVLMDTLKLAATNGSFQVALSNQNAAFDRLGISTISSSIETLFSGKPDFHAMFSQTIVTLSGLSRKVLRAEASRQTVITAIALKRFQLKHNYYPTNLALLVPEFVSVVPHDPVDGEPLRYRLQPDGNFLLYSIGEDGRDDGGNPSLEKHTESSSFNWIDLHARDWVWPQPATDAEIKYFYDHPPK
jgi:hypothetical protein